MKKNHNLILVFTKTFYIFCTNMETWELTQHITNTIWSWDLINIFWKSFSSLEWLISSIRGTFRFITALTIFLLRLAILIWVIKDASARSSSLWFQLLSVFLIIAFTPIIWLILYIAIRPQWWKWDKTPRRDTLFQKTQICENCWEFNNMDYLYCTYCWESLHIPCRECQHKYPKSYSYCPNCGAPQLEE